MAEEELVNSLKQLRKERAAIDAEIVQMESELLSITAKGHCRQCNKPMAEKNTCVYWDCTIGQHVSKKEWFCKECDSKCMKAQ